MGIKEEVVAESTAGKKEVLECEQLRVEADSWYSLGKCLLNAFSKLYPSLPSFLAYIQWPRTSRLHKCQNPPNQERETIILQLKYRTTQYVPSISESECRRPISRRSRSNNSNHRTESNQTTTEYRRSRRRRFQTKVIPLICVILR